MTKFLGALSGFTAAAIWGGMYVVSSYVFKSQAFEPFTLLVLRLIIGVATLAPIAAWRGELHYTRDQVRSLLGVGFVGYSISLGLQFVGTKLSGAANGALITSASPAFIVLFAFLILREQLTRFRIIALVLATVGVVIVVFDPTQVQLGLWGNVILLGAALTWGLYSVLVKWVGAKGLSTLAITVMVLIGGLPLTIPLSIYEIATTPIDSTKINLVIIGGVLYLGVISTALAMFLWNKSFELLDASVASLMFFAQPVVGVALGAVLLGDTLGANFFIGGAMILLGVLIASKR
ncbi:MAG: DMT family transporter [Chloroflexi bacterium]|nr:DMT family transporter [Chloroflexota bacterium]